MSGRVPAMVTLLISIPYTKLLQIWDRIDPYSQLESYRKSLERKNLVWKFTPPPSPKESETSW